MTSERKKLKLVLKPYQVILLGCILSYLFILNSNSIIAERNKEQLDKEKSKLFNKIISGRKLQDKSPGDGTGSTESPTGDEDEDNSKNLNGTEKVCKKGSEELQKYYETGDLSKLGFEDNKIECEDKEKDYFKALLNIVKTVINGKEESKSTRNLQNIDFEVIKDDVVTYAYHIIPIVVFLVIAILSIPGWLICCFCCCCNCCCCCCCKKPGCKIPCFIFTYVFYALAVVICIYGLSKTNHIFVGLADTECSVLKFFDEILDGEMKQDKPRWAGIKGINGILDDIVQEVKNLKEGSKGNLDHEIDEIDSNKALFIDAITTVENQFHETEPSLIDPTTTVIKKEYKDIYTTTSYDYKIGTSAEDSQEIKGIFVLDMIKFLGKYNDDTKKFEPENSFLDLWQQEYELISNKADEYLKIAQDSFGNIIDENSGDIISQLEDGKKMLNDIKNSFNDIKAEIADKIIDYSDTIDDYGRLGSKLVFGVLALMNIALAIFVLLLCFCSGKMCTNCCCCRCIFKFFLHLFWNILALLMIITFLVGFAFSLVGTVGYDAMSIISYVVSSENINSENPVLIDKLGDSKKYLDICINGDGKLEDAIGINMSDIGSFDNISSVQDQINDAKEQFENISQCFVFKEILKQLNDRTDLTSDTLTLVKYNTDLPNLKEIDLENSENAGNFLPFKTYLDFLNNNIEKSDETENNEKWEVGEDGLACKEGNANDDDYSSNPNPIFNPLKCKPLDRDWVFTLNGVASDKIDTSNTGEAIVKANIKTNIKASANIITDTLKLLEGVSSSDDTSFISILESVRKIYADNYLKQYIKALDAFKTILDNILNKLNNYIDKDNKENGGVFGFINGKFIGTNLKIILKYLKSALGHDIKTIGICLLIVGCSLALSISSTILLIIVINIDIDNNKKISQASEFKMDSGGRVIQYQ